MVWLWKQAKFFPIEYKGEWNVRSGELFHELEWFCFAVSPRENVVVIELPDVCEGEVAPHVQLGVPVQHKVEKETQTPRRRWHSSIR